MAKKSTAKQTPQAPAEMRVFLDLPTDLHLALKVHAMQKGMTLKGWCAIKLKEAYKQEGGK